MTTQPVRTAKPALEPVVRGQIESETAELREAVAKLKVAAEIEGIEPEGALGLFVENLGNILLTLGHLVEMQTVRIEQRANATAAASVKSIEEMRAATAACRAQVSRSTEGGGKADQSDHDT
jgi:hypothetical protein